MKKYIFEEVVPLLSYRFEVTNYGKSFAKYKVNTINLVAEDIDSLKQVFKTADICYREVNSKSIIIEGSKQYNALKSNLERASGEFLKKFTDNVVDIAGSIYLESIPSIEVFETSNALDILGIQHKIVENKFIINKDSVGKLKEILAKEI